MTDHEGPRIYVASLSDYNAGRLHGAWIDADQDPSDIASEVQHMLDKSTEPNAEEWAIHDFEGFYGLPIGEYESFGRVSEMAHAISEHGPAFAAYVAVLGDGEYATVDGFEDNYRGEWDSVSDYAEELAEYTGALPGELTWPLYCIDWARAGRELEMGGDIWTTDTGSGRVYVFSV